MHSHRNFLFLQGPHGPFFDQLGRALRAAGAQTWRVGFNEGDAVFWRDGASYIPFTQDRDAWPATLKTLLDAHAITDLVIYGDTRPIHADAIAHAKSRNINVHVFEEGYLRPYWITYERGGANGHSPLMDWTIADMRATLSKISRNHPPVPATWGDMRQHIFYGALYHWFVLARNRNYPQFKSHRSRSVAAEFRLHLRRFLMLPATAVSRAIATARIRRGAFPFHLVLLQLEHDASFQSHGPFATMIAFLETVLDGFARNAPKHHHLVFKAHPLEDGRAAIKTSILELAATKKLTDRVHYVEGGKLAHLLNATRAVITVNSTAAHQALWRGLPVKAFGTAVYGKPSLVSAKSLAAFFRTPEPPNAEDYKTFRTFLLETSQQPGGYYSAKGRRELLRQLPDLMLAEDDPYAALRKANTPAKPNLSTVSQSAQSRQTL